MTGWVLRLIIRVFGTAVVLIISSWAAGGLMHMPILSYQSPGGVASDIMMLDVSRMLTFNLTRASLAYNTNAAWSPDGRYVAFLSTSEQHTGIYIMDFDGRNQRLLIDVRDTGALAWSPDGTRIAFHVDMVASNHIFVMDVVGGQPQQLTTGATLNFDPAWSPDGRYLVFRSNRDSDELAAFTFRLYMIRPDGQDIRVLPEPVASGIPLLDTAVYNPTDPAWSPDGRYIAYSSDGRIVIMPMTEDETDSWQIAAVGGYMRRPAWSPDGEWLAYHAASPISSVHIIRSDGADARMLVTGIRPAWRP